MMVGGKSAGSQKVEAMAGSIPAASGRIFVSYRREETAYPAGWLYDRLADRFGRAQIFKDVDSIELAMTSWRSSPERSGPATYCWR